MPQSTHFTPLGNMSVEHFLKEYWQKKPLLIRQAFPNFQAPISADELAGFSLEDEITSRLIVETPGSTPFNSDWHVEHGPLNESRYSTLPGSHWTLLVQNVDSFDTEINSLLDTFSFIPNWRLDDIMISYAADKGSVGPHFDYYDVFLLQAEGKRRWKTGQICDAQSPLVPDLPMQILSEFNDVNEWVLEPGDMLYLPPQLAHWGVAEGECMTYSVGFRAPSHGDLLLDFSQEIASNLDQDQRYRDENTPKSNHPGEINPRVIDSIKEIVEHYSGNTELLAQWFGEYMTRSNASMDIAPHTCLTSEDLPEEEVFRLSPFARSAFYALSDQDALLFVNNLSWKISLPLAKALTEYAEISWSDLSVNDRKTLSELASMNVIIADD